MNRLFGCAHGSSASAGRAVGDRVALPVQPAVEVGRRVGRAALEPHLVGLRVVGDVGEDRLGARRDGLDRARVGLLVGVLGHAEHAELGVHAVEAAVLADPHPGDVVAVELDVVAVAERVGGQRHREVGLAGGAREAARDVPLLAGHLVGDAEQHELLGQELAGRPAVVGGLAQAVRDLAEQRVAAVGRAEVQDRPLVGDGDEVALVLRGALAEVLQVAGHVHGAHEAVRVGQVVDELDAHPGHPVHVQDDAAVVGQLDASRVLLERGAGRGHQVRDDVHGLARWTRPSSGR